jgi:hypothetical protein
VMSTHLGHQDAASHGDLLSSTELSGGFCAVIG